MFNCYIIFIYLTKAYSNINIDNQRTHQIYRATIESYHRYLLTESNNSGETSSMQPMLAIVLENFFNNDFFRLEDSVLMLIHKINFEAVSVINHEDEVPFNILYLLKEITKEEVLSEDLFSKLDKNVEKICQVANKIFSYLKPDEKEVNVIQNIMFVILQFEKKITDLDINRFLYRINELLTANNCNRRKKRFRPNRNNIIYRPHQSTLYFFDQLLFAIIGKEKSSIRFSPFKKVGIYLIEDNLISKTFKPLKLLNFHKIVFEKITTEVSCLNTYDNKLLTFIYIYLLKFVSEVTLLWCDCSIVESKQMKITCKFYVRNFRNNDTNYPAYLRDCTYKYYRSTYFIKSIELQILKKEFNNVRKQALYSSAEDVFLNECKCIWDKLISASSCFLPKYFSQNKYYKYIFGDKTGVRNIENEAQSKNFENEVPRFDKKLFLKYENDLEFTKNFDLDKYIKLNIRCITPYSLKDWKKIISNIKSIKEFNKALNDNIIYDYNYIQKYTKHQEKCYKLELELLKIQKLYSNLPNIIIDYKIFWPKADLKKQFKILLKEFFVLLEDTNELEKDYTKVYKNKPSEKINEMYMKNYYDYNSKNDVLQWAFCNMIINNNISDDEIFDEVFYTLVLDSNFEMPINETQVKRFFKYIKRLTAFHVLRQKTIKLYAYRQFLTFHLNESS